MVVVYLISVTLFGRKWQVQRRGGQTQWLGLASDLHTLRDRGGLQVTRSTPFFPTFWKELTLVVHLHLPNHQQNHQTIHLPLLAEQLPPLPRSVAHLPLQRSPSSPFKGSPLDPLPSVL